MSSRYNGPWQTLHFRITECILANATQCQQETANNNKKGLEKYINIHRFIWFLEKKQTVSTDRETNYKIESFTFTLSFLFTTTEQYKICITVDGTPIHHSISPLHSSLYEQSPKTPPLETARRNAK